jgi:hypothetical protein
MLDRFFRLICGVVAVFTFCLGGVMLILSLAMPFFGPEGLHCHPSSEVVLMALFVAGIGLGIIAFGVILIRISNKKNKPTQELHHEHGVTDKINDGKANKAERQP